MSETRTGLWWAILAVWLVAAIANYRTESLAKRVGQLEVQVERLEKR